MLIHNSPPNYQILYLSPLRDACLTRRNSGGHYAPSIATHLLAANSNNSSSAKIGVKTVGIINGFIDTAIQMESYPRFSQNNTYGIQLYDAKIAEAALQSFNEPQTGCKTLAASCNQAAASKDPNDAVPDPDVIQACAAAFVACYENVYLPVELFSGVSPRPPQRSGSQQALPTCLLTISRETRLISCISTRVSSLPCMQKVT